MLDQGYITQAEYDEAMADQVYDRILETAAVTADTTPYSYFTDALIEDVVQDFMDEKGYDRNTGIQSDLQWRAYHQIHAGYIYSGYL